MREDQQIQLRDIIGALLVRTREGGVEWVWNERLASATATLANGRVILSKDRDRDTQVRIQDTDWNTLEDVNVGYVQYKHLQRQADELYELARRSGLKIDSKLESILREIS